MITAEFEDVTTQMAAELLDNNESNRALRARKVAEYAADIRSGNWHTTGASIVIGQDGRLLDGQHRLAAILDTGQPLTLLVVRGAESASQVAMDTGLKRNLTDHLKMRGEANTVILATSLRHHWRWVSDEHSTEARSNATHAELMSSLERNPSLRIIVPYAAKIYQAVGLPAGLAGAMTHQLRMIDAEHMRGFFEEVLSGELLEHGSPTLTLRNWLLTQRSNTGGRRPYQSIYHAVTVKAWNAWVNGVDLRQLKWKKGGMRPEAFPLLSDLDGNTVTVRDELPR